MEGICDFQEDVINQFKENHVNLIHMLIADSEIEQLQVNHDNYLPDSNFFKDSEKYLYYLFNQLNNDNVRVDFEELGVDSMYTEINIMTLPDPHPDYFHMSMNESFKNTENYNEILRRISDEETIDYEVIHYIDHDLNRPGPELIINIDENKKLPIYRIDRNRLYLKMEEYQNAQMSFNQATIKI